MNDDVEWLQDYDEWLRFLDENPRHREEYEQMCEQWIDVTPDDYPC